MAGSNATGGMNGRYDENARLIAAGDGGFDGTLVPQRGSTQSQRHIGGAAGGRALWRSDTRRYRRRGYVSHEAQIGREQGLEGRENMGITAQRTGRNGEMRYDVLDVNCRPRSPRPATPTPDNPPSRGARGGLPGGGSPLSFSGGSSRGWCGWICVSVILRGQAGCGMVPGLGGGWFAVACLRQGILRRIGSRYPSSGGMAGWGGSGSIISLWLGYGEGHVGRVCASLRASAGILGVCPGRSMRGWGKTLIAAIGSEGKAPLSPVLTTENPEDRRGIGGQELTAVFEL